MLTARPNIVCGWSRLTRYFLVVSDSDGLTTPSAVKVGGCDANYFYNFSSGNQNRNSYPMRSGNKISCIDFAHSEHSGLIQL